MLLSRSGQADVSYMFLTERSFSCRALPLWRCQSTEAAKPRQHIGYISPNRTQATKATLSDPYNEGYEIILHVFDLQHLVATVHATQRLPRPTTSSQRAEFVPHNTHNPRAHPDASSDAPDADETPRANPRPEHRRNARTDRPCDFQTFPERD